VTIPEKAWKETDLGADQLPNCTETERFLVNQAMDAERKTLEQGLSFCLNMLILVRQQIWPSLLAAVIVSLAREHHWFPRQFLIQLAEQLTVAAESCEPENESLKEACRGL
jgi:hypothetical protein